MATGSVNYWKFATIGILLVGATVAATLLVAGGDSKTEQAASPSESSKLQSDSAAPAEDRSASMANAGPEDRHVGRQQSPRVSKADRQHTGSAPPQPYPPQAAYPAQPAYPPQSVMEACNRYANEQVNSKTEEVLKNAALGAAIGAAVGAAGGAIAGGGSGAGKGAAIGGVTGAAGGTLYGLNENKSHDAQYQAAYASCMRSKGY
jgi:outer membrane murein-binding lipoprotein Lpp